MSVLNDINLLARQLRQAAQDLRTSATQLDAQADALVMVLAILQQSQAPLASAPTQQVASAQ